MALSAYFPAGPNIFVERFGLDFEDFAVGQRFRHRPGITLSQRDNVIDSLETMNGAMLHFDAHYAGQTSWKRPLAMPCPVCGGLVVQENKELAKCTRCEHTLPMTAVPDTTAPERVAE